MLDSFRACSEIGGKDDAHAPGMDVGTDEDDYDADADDDGDTTQSEEVASNSDEGEHDARCDPTEESVSKPRLAIFAENSEF